MEQEWDMFPARNEKERDMSVTSKCSATLIEVVAQVESLEAVGELHIPYNSQQAWCKFQTKGVTV